MTAQEKLPSREVTEPVNLELAAGTFSELKPVGRAGGRANVIELEVCGRRLVSAESWTKHWCNSEHES